MNRLAELLSSSNHFSTDIAFSRWRSAVPEENQNEVLDGGSLPLARDSKGMVGSSSVNGDNGTADLGLPTGTNNAIPAPIGPVKSPTQQLVDSGTNSSQVDVSQQQPQQSQSQPQPGPMPQGPGGGGNGGNAMVPGLGPPGPNNPFFNPYGPPMPPHGPMFGQPPIMPGRMFPMGKFIIVAIAAS